MMDSNMPTRECQSPNKIQRKEQDLCPMEPTSEGCLAGDTYVLVPDRMDICTPAIDALIHAGSSRSFA